MLRTRLKGALGLALDHAAHGIDREGKAHGPGAEFLGGEAESEQIKANLAGFGGLGAGLHGDGVLGV